MTYIYIYTYTCMYIYIYIYIHRERERERERERDIDSLIRVARSLRRSSQLRVSKQASKHACALLPPSESSSLSLSLNVRSLHTYVHTTYQEKRRPCLRREEATRERGAIATRRRGAMRTYNMVCRCNTLYYTRIRIIVTANEAIAYANIVL